ncbi:3-methyladenine DNA glycosylase [Loktanella sp. IMCC34160]|uniref:DNA-3-methyladenine glycosylase I n=1 Tax=Loktanella sp. IMCC34160 TaxID=2510646 RepID=UPI00101CFBDD|nr:DNA-3-methyladenine glycosylase I [Loktanella sp. IMCC34160]RYG89316.1 3-methyladenine DNA glycosylase [Loktanella sp. IMCC34160]
MRKFDDILAMAAERKGSFGAVLDGIAAAKPPEEIAAIPDDLWLAGMARGIMQAGISWTVVDKKWPGIEEAFDHFDVGRCAMISDDRFDALIADPRIIRSPPKVRAIQENAVFIQEVARDHGSFGRRIADWPAEDFAGLLQWMQKSGSRLGGSTGAYLLRKMGKDGFILSRDVVARLVAEGVIDKAPTSKKAWAAVQEAFNTWAEQSGQPLTVISRVLAQSINN